MDLPMNYVALSLGLLQTNCYVVWNERKQAVLIDPSAEPEAIRAAVAQQGVTPLAILLTHAHFDHIAAVPAIQREFALPVYLHAADEPLYASPRNCMPPYVPEPVAGLPPTQPALPPLPDDLRPEILETPGHTLGGVAFYYPAASLAFVGDTLFSSSIGRSDLPGGDFDQLMQSIHRVLLTLPDSVSICPGHGPTSTIGRERVANPYLN
jgi:glyoxylase-like metal-dependent hydrolase (beta-lactamase superfamily II)